MRSCTSCGSEVQDSARFCPDCGSASDADVFATRTVASVASAPRRKQSTDSRSAAFRTSTTSTDGARFLPGTVVAGRYRIVALLGRGGMGEVYRADDLSLGQQVALKFLPDAIAQNEDALRRLKNEVRVARQVSHPNVCRVYDAGELDGLVFLSMEYVDGEDLGGLLRRIGRLPEDKAVQISRQICAGLAAAHDKGILHRDLKPANIMLDGRGQALLTDFGLAALAEDVQGNEIRNGTPAYMAPEQLAGKAVNVRSDIYSLGLVLYEIFTGKRPYEADTLAELVRAREETTPTSLTTVVRDLDPTIERAILRCLESDPSKRPASALLVSAALPGGDRLAAALAAGETPSPQMVAAAGEGTGLSPRVATAVFAAVLCALAAVCILMNRQSAVDQMNLELGPEVLAQKARETIQQLGYSPKAVDSAHHYDYNSDFLGYVERNDKPPVWTRIFSQRPTPLEFWYRQSPRMLLTLDVTDDHMTPGTVQFGNPEPVWSGMVDVVLDSSGRLTQFHAMPPQVVEHPVTPVPAVDWAPLFRAADIDVTKLQPAEPQWTWLQGFDTRAAWTGKWPGSDRPLRVEAAAFQGKPVAFQLMGPWTKHDRTVKPSGSNNTTMAFLVVFLVTTGAAAVLARRNFLRGRGDRNGAMKLARWMAIVHVALWACRTHWMWNLGMLVLLIIAISFALFQGAISWLLYMALEPFVRRHWPQTLISWSRVLTGRIQDPIVGRDVLLGTALGALWAMIIAIGLVVNGASSSPDLPGSDYISGFRSGLGSWLVHVPSGVRGTLVFFFVAFVLRVLLKNQWLSGLAFTLFWAVPKILSSENHFWLVVPLQLLVYGVAAIVVGRFGLLSLAVGIFMTDMILSVPITASGTIWFFPVTAFCIGSVVAMVVWAYRASIPGVSLIGKDAFD